MSSIIPKLNKPKMRISLAFYDDKCVYFLKFRKGNLSIVSLRDIEDPYISISSHNLFLKNDDLAAVESYLESILLWLDKKIVTNKDSAVGSAISASVKIFDNLGKIILFSSNGCSTGTGAVMTDLPYAEVYWTKDEDKLYEPKHSYITELAHKFIDKSVALDLFYIHKQNHQVDLPSLILLSEQTNGTVFSYKDSDLSNEQLFHDMWRHLNNTFYYAITAVPRSSYQFEASGSLLVAGKSKAIVTLPSCDSLSNFIIEYQINETLTEYSHYFFQIAVAYTNELLESYIRVFNFKAQAFMSPATVYDTGDFEVAARYWFLRIIDENKLNPKNLLSAVRNLLVKILFHRRQFVRN